MKSKRLRKSQVWANFAFYLKDLNCIGQQHMSLRQLSVLPSILVRNLFFLQKLSDNFSCIFISPLKPSNVEFPTVNYSHQFSSSSRCASNYNQNVQYQLEINVNLKVIIVSVNFIHLNHWISVIQKFKSSWIISLNVAFLS